ncbi:MAG: hypothetical protein QXP72_00905 [Desulfurococcaceae archaeon]
MARTNNVLFKGFTYIVISSIILLNYIIITNESYLGAFQNGCIIRLSPPYRFSSKIYSYDIEENTLSLSVINGFALTYCNLNEETDLYIIKSSGIDIYIVLSSLFILFILFFTYRRLEHISKTVLYIIISLVILVVVLNYMYFYESSKPIKSFELIERNKPLVCDRYGNYNICVLDKLVGRSKLFINPGVRGNLTISIGGSVELIELNNTYSKFIDAEDKDVIVAFITTDHLSNITYRRLTYESLGTNRISDSILDILTIAASSVKITILIIMNKFIRIPRKKRVENTANV